MNKKLMVGALAVALIGGGITGAALLPSTNAASDTTDANTPATIQQDQPAVDNDQEVNDDGDKEVNDDNDQETNDDGDNDQEVNDDGQPSAIITKEQSTAVALKETPGEVLSVELETENGVAAYTVTIKDKKGQQQEVTVDANSGKIIPEND
ncbi:PepSY domain-containing protein [Cohnella yongneupensis]|uniref:PepSY domain-containing protein n=1 Tax=Cohnella yongneupensis TaxID=425006 RepID=A0ABW0R0Q4_9BACL